MTDTPGTGSAPDAAAVAAAAAAAAAANANKPWYDGAIPANADGTPDSVMVGHLQARGWDKLEPKAAAIAAAKAHHEAEKHIGVPANQILRIPKDAADAEGWNRVNTFLKVPTDVKDYDFSTIKFTDGEPVDAKFLDTLRPVLQQAHVSKDAAPAVVKAVVSYLEQSEVGDVKAKADALALERDTLRINWGSNVEANLVIARNAADKLGIKPEAVEALQNQVGYAAVMEMFRNIGSRIGEDTFVRGGPNGSNGVMSAEQAEATMNEKMNDRDFFNRLNAGDASAKKEFDNLTRMISAARVARDNALDSTIIRVET